MRRFLVALALLCVALPVKAQTPGFAGGPNAHNCPIYDTTVLSAGNSVALSSCTVDTGPYSVVFYIISGEVICDPGSIAGVIMNGGYGPRPIQDFDELGAHVVGSITGGVMTVTSMVTPFPQFRIAPGHLLHDAFGGTHIPTDLSGTRGSKLTVTAQLTSTQAGGLLGGTGTYSVSDGSVSFGDQDIWSLNTVVELGSPPNSGQLSRGPLDVFFCGTSGARQIVTFAGSIDNSAYPSNKFLTAWVVLLLASFPLFGIEVQSASFQNGTITILPMNFTGGAINGLGGAN